MADEDIEKWWKHSRPEIITLNVRVEEWFPRCYKCDMKSQDRADCLPLPVKFKERQGGEK